MRNTSYLVPIICLVSMLIILLTSCEKEEYEPWTYVPENQDNDTTTWRDNYTDGGTIPYDTSTAPTLVGTKWVLTKMVTSFATEYPNDTLEFINSNEYTINSGPIPRTYQLNSIPSSTNYDLSLYYFTPFGGSHYSANVGYYFIQDGVIDNAEFKNINNTTSKIRAWFKKL